MHVQSVSRLSEDQGGGGRGGGTASSSVQTAGHLGWKSKDCHEYIMSWLTVKERVAVGCDGSRLLGLIKPNSCWFLLAGGWRVDGQRRAGVVKER